MKEKWIVNSQILPKKQEKVISEIWIKGYKTVEYITGALLQGK